MAKPAVVEKTNGHHDASARDHHQHHHHKVRFIPLSYQAGDNQEQSNASALALIQSLRPGWGKEVELKRFTDGITNTLLQAKPRKSHNNHNGHKSHEGRGETAAEEEEEEEEEAREREAILLRAYGNGTDLLIDRQREAQNHELLSRYGLAPELLALFENGMLYRFIRGRVTTPQDLRRPEIYRAVARRLAQWHYTVPCLPAAGLAKRPGAAPAATATANGDNGIKDITPGKLSPNVWTVMQKWIRNLPVGTAAQRERQESLQRELNRLVAELSERPGLGKDGLVFAHCDLLSGNVIVLPSPTVPAAPAASSNGSSNGNGHHIENGGATAAAAPVEVTFIDYEYATPSPAAFDLANHFAEWGGFDCDFSVLPTRSQRRGFIREYVRVYFSGGSSCGPVTAASLSSSSSDGDQDDDPAVDRLFAEVDLFRGVPGFYWGIWALIQATISDIDFDYASYAETRLGEYWAWRAEQDGSRAREGREMPLRERRWSQEE